MSDDLLANLPVRNLKSLRLPSTGEFDSETDDCAVTGGPSQPFVIDKVRPASMVKTHIAAVGFCPAFSVGGVRHALADHRIGRPLRRRLGDGNHARGISHEKALGYVAEDGGTGRT